MSRSSSPFQRQTVRGRLFLLIAALGVPSVAIISILSWEFYRTQQEAVRAELANTARAVATVADTEVERCVTMLETLTAVRSLRENDWTTFDATARRVLADPKRWLVVVDMEGRQLVNTRLPRGTPIPDIDLAPSYLEAMRAGTTYVSGVVHGPAAQRLVLHVGMPLKQSDGTLLGVSIVMTPDNLAEIFEVQRFAPDGVISLVDREGRIIVRNPSKPEFIGGAATPDMVAAVQQRRELVQDSVTLEGIPVLTAVAPAKSGWTVLIGIPKAKLFASAQRLFLIGLGSALCVTLGAIGLALWIARAVVRGVDGLAQDAERLAHGETPRAETGHLAEIDVVAQAMRQLAQTRSEAEGQLREARDRLRDYAQDLEKKVAERTASLREAVSQMEEFSYTVSHDLRGPLRTMSGYANALLEDHGASLDPEARGFLERIVRASERMSRLTSELLNYSRVARADLVRQPLALEPMVRGIVEHHEQLSPKVADVTVVTPMDDVLAHETSLTQALTNLLLNAAKFVRPGQRPSVTVRTERRVNRVRIWVEDAGIGVDLQHQSRLFRIFERAPQAHGFAGTGVGLAIVRKVAEKSGGACGVESDGASGSRFWIELDAAKRV